MDIELLSKIVELADLGDGRVGLDHLVAELGRPREELAGRLRVLADHGLFKYDDVAFNGYTGQRPHIHLVWDVTPYGRALVERHARSSV